MSEAKALFKRHENQFREEMIRAFPGKALNVESAVSSLATIYAACIIAEAISNEPDVEAKVCPKCSKWE